MGVRTRGSWWSLGWNVARWWLSQDWKWGAAWRKSGNFWELREGILEGWVRGQDGLRKVHWGARVGEGG